MSVEGNENRVRERTNAVKEVSQESMKSSNYTPKVTIDQPSRKLPKDIKSNDKPIVDPDHSIQVPINYSTIIMAFICLIFTAIFCYYSYVSGPLSPKTKGLFLVASILYWILFMILFVPPLPQFQTYNDFADQRTLRQLTSLSLKFDIPNAFDVLSNVPFLFTGLQGLVLLLFTDRIPLLTSFERVVWSIHFLSICSICIGSSYYHLKPSNRTLVWDRLPMTVAFATLFVLVIVERLNSFWGKCFLPFLFILAISSCIYWYYRDDLRGYILAQFCPVIYVPILLFLSSSPYTGTICYIYAWIFHGLAKKCENSDKEIFRLTSNKISGHTLKHLSTALAIYILLHMLQVRDII